MFSLLSIKRLVTSSYAYERAKTWPINHFYPISTKLCDAYNQTDERTAITEIDVCSTTSNVSVNHPTSADRNFITSARNNSTQTYNAKQTTTVNN